MSTFLFPTLTFVVYLLSLLIVFNHIFSKEFFFWITPFIFCLFFTFFQAFSLYGIYGDINNISLDIFKDIPSFATHLNSTLFAFGFSIFWLILIISFHQILKTHKNPKDKRKDLMKKNYYAAQYAQKIEQKEQDIEIKKRKEQKEYGTQKPVLNQFSENWINKFED